MTEIRFLASAYKDGTAPGSRNIHVVLMSEVDSGRHVELGTLNMTPDEYEAFTARLFSDSVRPSGPTLPTRADLDPDNDPITPLTDLEPRHGQAAH